MLVVKKNGGEDMAWEKVKLKDVCTLIVDCPHSTAPNEGKGYPLIRTPNIGRGRLLLDGVHRVSKAVYDRRNIRAIPQENDLIFAREATAGNVAIVQKNEKVCLGQRTVLLRPDPKYVDSDYLVYCLLAPEQQYNLLGSANGSTVAHVNLPVIRNLTISLPPLDVQKRIGQVLKTYDDLIENNRRQVRLLEEAAQRLYKEWFVKFHFPGWEETKLVDGLPVGWKKSKIKDVSSIIKRGISPIYDEEGVSQVISQKCLRNLAMDIGLARKQSKPFDKSLNIQDGDTLICSTGIGTYGRVGNVFGTYENVTFDSHVTMVRGNEKVGKQFLFWSLKYVQPYLMSMGQGSTNQQELYRDVIAQVEILIPTWDVLKKFEESESIIHKELTNHMNQIQFLQEARNRFLPRLMQEGS